MWISKQPFFWAWESYFLLFSVPPFLHQAEGKALSRSLSCFILVQKICIWVLTGVVQVQKFFLYCLIIPGWVLLLPTSNWFLVMLLLLEDKFDKRLDFLNTSTVEVSWKKDDLSFSDDPVLAHLCELLCDLTISFGASQWEAQRLCSTAIPKSLYYCVQWRPVTIMWCN